MNGKTLLETSQPESARAKCAVCGHVLTREGKCWFSPKHSQETATPVLVSIPNVEGETVTQTEIVDKYLDAAADAVFDIVTGELHEPPAPEQMVLDPNLFPPTKREKVKTVKIGFAGSVEMTRRAFEEMCSTQLEPGREVTLTVSGFVPAPHAKWVKRSEGTGDDKLTWWEQVGQVAIKVTDISSEDGIEVGGFYHED